jgi:hypothetical protein
MGVRAVGPAVFHSKVAIPAILVTEQISWWIITLIGW